MNRRQQNFQIINDINRLPYGWPFHMIGNDHSIAENIILGIESDRL